MAFSVNKQTVLGNLGRDPELRYTQAGKAICRLNVATSESWGRGEGRKEKTTWHRLVLWDKIAETAARLLRKGDKIYAEGRTETDEYTDKEGIKRWSTEVNVREIVFLTTSGESSQSPAEGGPYRRTVHPQQGGGGDYGGGHQGGGDYGGGAQDGGVVDSEDIPF
tara:strand:- start:353 stop:847 length:495 start_codon:yes stop_codon:yes gene_type:complete